MSINYSITKNDRNILRELAKKYMEYAGLPVMEERRKLWYAHNSLKGSRPVVVMETDTFQSDIMPRLRCETPAAREIEWNLVKALINHELVDDDKVISPYYSVYWKIGIREFGLEIDTDYAEDSEGRKIGFARRHPIADLKKDFNIIGPSEYSVDKKGTLEWKSFVEGVFGDILPVRIKNNSLAWHATPSNKVVALMSLEKMMFSMVDYPDEMHALLRLIRDDILAYVRWQEKEGLLTLSNENDYTGAGSYGFTDELPTEDCRKNGKVTAKDLWLNINSQESVGISPAMFGEFIYPYYHDIAKEFGLVYYGCCEPVHTIWDDYISKLPGLRKVSVSPWCNEEFMGDALKGSKVIYSRKPSPNYIGVGSFDEEGFRGHMAKTLKAAKGCSLEIIFRDVYTLSGDLSKPGKAVGIVRELIEKMW